MRLKPTNDFVFQRIFGKVGNERIVKSLIEAIIPDKIENLKLTESKILERDLITDKLGILDINVTVNDDCPIDIEMQMIDQGNIENRLAFYWGKLYEKTIKRGDDYSEMKRTIVIMFANFEIERLKEIPEYHTTWKILEKNHPECVLTNNFEIDIIEMPKMLKLADFKENDDENRVLSTWVNFITNPDGMEENEMSEIEEIELAKKELERINADEKEVRLAELREKYVSEMKSIENKGFNKGLENGLERGYERGLKQGLEDGIKQGIKQGLEDGMKQGIKQGLEDGMKQGIKQGLEDGMKQGLEDGMKQGLEDGMKQGSKEKQIEIAKKLKVKNMPIEEIAEITELKKEEIENI
jgi:predicted transposase/invertase (TIGR01784 family)